MVVKIKMFSDDIIKPVYDINVGNWVDLRCSIDIDLKAGEYYEIPLGVAMQLPYAYEAYLISRSSTFKKYGIIQTNGMGLIDNSYSGDNDEWKMPVYATKDCHIFKNDRICQFRIMPNMNYKYPMYFNYVDKLEDNDRGGFGSTGRG